MGVSRSALLPHLPLEIRALVYASCVDPHPTDSHPTDRTFGEVCSLRLVEKEASSILRRSLAIQQRACLLSLCMLQESAAHVERAYKFRLEDALASPEAVGRAPDAMWQLVASHFQVLAMTCVLENRETSAMTSYVLHGAEDGVLDAVFSRVGAHGLRIATRKDEAFTFFFDAKGAALLRAAWSAALSSYLGACFVRIVAATR